MAERQRCAIYTRKSSDEGLEQGFNSLHAQREACEAYVLSQAGEGWTALSTAYDVVYKVDRLTRSLADFAKIVERFDAKGVSFVSVTQAFNTTSSMGRLTLNVLLSFAQFEREVTAERIRDKIAASKAKGLWMGGRVPLGYEVVDHRLVVSTAEAPVVRGIFERYLQLGTVRALQPALEALGVRSKVWTNRQGRVTGGEVFSRGALYYLLSNPVYRGAIRHKEKLYEEAHPALIDGDLWSRTQAQLKSQGAVMPCTPRAAGAVLLKGRVFDDRGNPMVAAHTCRGSTRYRYYVSLVAHQGRAEAAGALPRVPMITLDETVVAAVRGYIFRGRIGEGAADGRVAEAIRRVVVAEDHLRIELAPEAVPHDVQPGPFRAELAGDIFAITVPLRLKRRQGALFIQAEGVPEQNGRIDRALVRGVVLARRWARQLEDGCVASTKDIARRNSLCEHYTARLMPLAYLAPDLTADILQGRQPASLSLKALTAKPLPLSWEEQRRLFAA